MPEPNKPGPNVLPVQNKMEVTSMYYSSGKLRSLCEARQSRRRGSQIGLYHRQRSGGPDGSLLSGAGWPDEGGEGTRFEKDPLPGGACDGHKYDVGYVMRGGREMDNHFEVMWDLLRSIPSLETEGASVLDEYYWLNKADPNYSLCRAT